MGTIYDGRPKVKHEVINGVECKRCTKCSEWKPLSDFNKKKDMSDGLRNACRVCQNKSSKKYREVNVEKERERASINRIKYNDYYKNYQQKWELENKEKRNVQDQNRKARLKGLPATLTFEEWLETKEYFNHSCSYCGNSNVELAHDHFVPLSTDTHLGTVKGNVIPVCKSCNSSKHSNLFEEWYPRQPFYSSDREKLILDFVLKE